MRVAVIGAGIVGLACAEELVRCGHDVRVFDPDPGGGATRAAAGMLAPAGEAWHGETDLLRLGVASARLWPEYAARLQAASGVDIDLRTAGTLLVGQDHDDLQQVRRSLDVLAADDHAAARHRSLAAAIDLSYELLGEADRQAFDRLSVFPGDFDLDAAAAVVAPGEDLLDVLSGLVDASVVEVSSAGPRRYRLLETLRTYGLGHLDAEAHARLRQRHTEHYRRLALAAGPEVGPDSESTDNAAWRERLTDEAHNLRHAVAWSLAHEPPALTLEFARATTWMEFMAGHYEACAELAARMLDGAGDAPPELRAWALLHGAYARNYTGDLAGAEAAGREAVDLFTSCDVPSGRAWALWNLGLTAELASGDVDAGLPLYERATETLRGAGCRVSAARLQVLNVRQLVLADRLTDDLVRTLDDAEAVLRAAHDPDLSSADVARIEVASATGDAAALERVAQDLIRHRPKRNDQELPFLALATARRLAGDSETAWHLLAGSALRLLEEGNQLELGVVLQSLATDAAALGQPVLAARLWGAGTGLCPEFAMTRRVNAPYLDPARAELGERFDREADAGRRLPPDDLAELLAFDTPGGA